MVFRLGAFLPSRNGKHDDVQHLNAGAARYRLEAYLNDVVQRRGSGFSKVA